MMQLPACDVCGKAVSIEDGGLWISFKKVRDVQEARVAWEKNHKADVSGVIDWLGYPGSIPWVWGHAGCGAEASYWIEASRFDTVTKALHWTIHLMDKNWLESTRWQDAIRRFYPECG